VWQLSAPPRLEVMAAAAASQKIQVRMRLYGKEISGFSDAAEV